jgi:hypothetical protein
MYIVLNVYTVYYIQELKEKLENHQVFLFHFISRLNPPKSRSAIPLYCVQVGRSFLILLPT